MRKRLYLQSAICSCENGEELAIIINISVITCDEILSTTKIVRKKK